MVDYHFWTGDQADQADQDLEHLEHVDHAKTSQIYKQADRRASRTPFLVFNFINKLLLYYLR